jgi:hypothetical protein
LRRPGRRNHRTIRKALQTDVKRSSTRKHPKAQVEVKQNSRIFCEFGRDGGGEACTIAASMPAAPQSPAKTQSAGLAPERSLTQRMDALKRANEIRTRRARLKRDLKAGRAQIHGLLLDPPEYLLTAKVFDLLLAVPKYGRVKVNRILTHCRISPSKTIGGLSERQRNELVSYLRR